MTKLRDIVTKFKITHQDSARYNTARSIWMKILSIYYAPGLHLLRSRIILKVGRDKYKTASKKAVIVFPNYVGRAPYLLSGGYVLSNIFLVCNVKPISFVKQLKADLAIDWQDSTISTINSKIYMNESYSLAKRKNKYSIQKVINCKCSDISKNKISEISRTVFNFQLNIDPTTYVGQIVRKSTINGRHDRQIMQAPINPRDVRNDSVYCKLIDNVYCDYATDYRLIYIDGVLDIFYEKRRSITQRFANRNNEVILRSTESEFSTDEISQIEQFCQQLHANYGELDV